MFKNLTLNVSNRWIRSMMDRGELYLVNAPSTCGLYVLLDSTRMPTFHVRSDDGIDYAGWLFGNIALVRGDTRIPKGAIELPHDDACAFDKAAEKCRDSWQFSPRDYEVAYGHIMKAFAEHLRRLITEKKDEAR